MHHAHGLDRISTLSFKDKYNWSFLQNQNQIYDSECTKQWKIIKKNINHKRNGHQYCQRNLHFDTAVGVDPVLALYFFFAYCFYFQIKRFVWILRIFYIPISRYVCAIRKVQTPLLWMSAVQRTNLRQQIWGYLILSAKRYFRINLMSE